MTIVFDEFDWDKGNKTKCQKHGVPPSEIEEIFDNRPFIMPDIKHSQTEQRYKAIGTNDKGRYVFMVFTIRENDDGRRLLRPISARYMHKKEIKHYEETISRF